MPCTNRSASCQVAVYQRIVEGIGADPHCTATVEHVLTEHIAALRRAGAQR